MLVRLFLLVAAGLFMISGCSPDYVKPSVTVEVHGTVLLDGSPVRDAKVFFVSEEVNRAEKFSVSKGTTDTHGKFELAMLDGNAGATAGTYRVYISRIAEVYSLTEKDDAEEQGKSEQQQAYEASLEALLESFEGPGYIPPRWEVVSESVKQTDGEVIPFYYNRNSELTVQVTAGIGIQRIEFELSGVDPLLAKAKLAKTQDDL